MAKKSNGKDEKSKREKRRERRQKRKEEEFVLRKQKKAESPAVRKKAKEGVIHLQTSKLKTGTKGQKEMEARGRRMKSKILVPVPGKSKRKKVEEPEKSKKTTPQEEKMEIEYRLVDVTPKGSEVKGKTTGKISEKEYKRMKGEEKDQRKIGTDKPTSERIEEIRRKEGIKGKMTVAEEEKKGKPTEKKTTGDKVGSDIKSAGSKRPYVRTSVSTEKGKGKGRGGQARKVKYKEKRKFATRKAAKEEQKRLAEKLGASGIVPRRRGKTVKMKEVRRSKKRRGNSFYDPKREGRRRKRRRR